jgi:hypothetical protein
LQVQIHAAGGILAQIRFWLLTRFVPSAGNSKIADNILVFNNLWQIGAVFGEK